MIPTPDDQLWLESLPLDWQHYIEGDGGLRGFLSSWAIMVREGDALQRMDLEPLRRIADLRELDWWAAPLASLHQLPELNIRVLSVKTASLDGIERFPRLAKLDVITDTPLGPLAAAAKLRTLTLPNSGGDLDELPAARLLTELTVTPRDARQFAQIAGLPKLQTLELDLRNIPRAIDELDWAPLRGLKSLTIEGAEPTSLDGFAPLLKLERIEFRSIGDADVSAMGALPALKYVTMRPTATLSGVEQLAENPSLVELSSDIAVERIVHERRPELVFRSVLNSMTEEEEAEWDSWGD